MGRDAAGRCYADFERAPYAEAVVGRQSDHSSPVSRTVRAVDLAYPPAYAQVSQSQEGQIMIQFDESETG